MTEATSQTNGQAEHDPLADWDLVPDMTGRAVAKACRDAGMHVHLVKNRLVSNESWFTDALALHRPELYERLRDYLKQPRRFGLTSLFDVTAESVEWLWPDFIARGMVHLLVGYSKTNKSTLIIELATILTQGYDWPDGSPGPSPSNVLLMSAEDSLTKTIKPRLDAAGGRANRVFYLNRGRGPNPEDKVRFSLANGADLDELRELIDDHSIRVVFIDPLDSFVGGKFDSNSSTDVRGVVDNLNDLADELNVAVVCMRHFRKSSGAGPVRVQDLIMGSRAYEAGARITLMVTKASRDPSDWSRTLTVMQSNIGPDSIGIDFEARIVDGVVCCEWVGGRRQVDPDELVAPSKTKDRTSAKEWINQALASGPKPSAMMSKEATEMGFKERTIKRAKSELSVESKKSGSVWWWCLPGQKPPKSSGKAQGGQPQESGILANCEIQGGQIP